MKKVAKFGYSCVTSVSFLVVSLVLLSMMAMIGISTYLSVRGSILSLQVQDHATKEKFGAISQKLEQLMSDVKSGVLGVKGFTRNLAEFILDDTEASMKTAVRCWFEYARSIASKLGYTQFDFGVWIYQQVSPNVFNHTTQFSYSYENLSYGSGYGEITPLTVYNVVDSPIPEPREAGDIDIFTPVGESSLIFYFEEINGIYSTRHSCWDFWIGTLNGFVTPFLSFSLGDPLFNVDTSNGPSNLTVNVWFGLPLIKVSEFISEYNPEGSYTWVIELQRDYLMASSDAAGGNDLAVNKSVFISPTKYERNSVIAKISSTIMEGEHMKTVTAEERTTVKLDLHGHLVYTTYLNSSEYRGQWLVVNAKAKNLIYRDAVISTTISFTTVVAVVLVIVVCWGAVLASFTRSFSLLMKDIEMIENMQLDDIKLERKHGFYEISLLKNKFNFMVNKLKEFRAFLPSVILGAVKETKPAEIDEEQHSECVDPPSPQISTARSPCERSSKSREYPLSGNISSDGSTIDSFHSMAVGNDDEGFELSLRQKFRYFVIISISGLREMISAHETNTVIKFSAAMFELIQSLSACRGSINHYSLDSFLLTFSQEFHCVLFALVLWERLCKNFGNFPKIKTFVVVGCDNVFIGNIGSKTMKTPTCYSDKMSKLKMFISRKIEESSNERVAMYFTHDSEQRISKRYVRKPTDVFLHGKDAVFLYKVIEKIDRTDSIDEGDIRAINILSLEEEEKMNKYTTLSDAVNMFVRGERKKSLHEIKCYLKKNKKDLEVSTLGYSMKKINKIIAQEKEKVL